MQKDSEYRQHAKECRLLARKVDVPQHREQLLKMAEMWETLAQERQELHRRHPELRPAARPLRDSASDETAD